MIKERVSEIICKVTGRTDLGDLCDQEGLWDSMQNIEIVLSAEREFNISFGSEEIAELKSINKIVKIIESKII